MTRLATLLLATLLSQAAPAMAQPATPDWNAWQLLMWQEKTPAQFDGLRALGFTGVKLRATGGVVDQARRTALDQAAMPYYLENVATDFYAPYHRYTEGKPVTWLFDAAKARYRADPQDPAVFIREPGLSDPAWLTRIRDRVTTLAAAHAGPRLLFLNLADEAGIGDLAAAWDADVAPAALAAFRNWLRIRYPTLDDLNRQWGTAHPTWDAVLPEGTDAALRRTDGNFSAWSDFKAFMDAAFAQAVRTGRDAARTGGALAALEGGQVPGWGGYDYALLAPALDVMEIYDFGDALDLAMAANPGLIALRTSFGSGPREAHAQWRHALHGGRGTIVWDEADDIVQPGGAPGPRGHDLAALHAGIAAAAPALRASRPDPDPVAVLVNQDSFRIRWLLDRRAADHDWTARDAEREYDDNAWRAARRMLLGRLGEIGVQPRLLASLQGPALQGVRVLVLAHAIALSDADLAALQAFRAAGGTVLADTEPALFDGHGRRRDTPPLSDVPHPAAVRPSGTPSTPALLDELATLLTQAGAPPRATFRGPDGARATGIEVRWFAGAQGRLMSIQAAEPFAGPARIQVDGAVPLQDLAGAPSPPDLPLDPAIPRLLRLRATGAEPSPPLLR